MDADTPSHDMLPTTEPDGQSTDVPADPAVAAPRVADGTAGGLPAWLERYGADVRGAAVAVGLSVLLGPLAGLLWNTLAPHVLVGNSGGTVYWLAPESKTFVAQDGWFAGVTALAGIITVTVVTLAARSRGGIGAVLGLAVGGIVGALACLGTGVLVGPGDVVTQADNTSGPFAAPLELRSIGFLFTWPLLAVLIHLIIQLVRRDDDREPEAAKPAEVAEA